MISKKDALTLGILAVGGIAAASVVAGGDAGGEGGLTQRKAGGILGTYGGEPQDDYGGVKLPQEPTVVFSQGRDYSGLLQSFIGAEEAPVPRGVHGVSSAGKKISKGAGMALGYTGYVTPTVPTPVSPGYIAGVTKFVPYKEPTYIPSPVAPPYVAKSGGGGTTKKKATPKKKYVRRSKTGYTYKGGKLSKK